MLSQLITTIDLISEYLPNLCHYHVPSASLFRNVLIIFADDQNRLFFNYLKLLTYLFTNMLFSHSYMSPTQDIFRSTSIVKHLSIIVSLRNSYFIRNNVFITKRLLIKYGLKKIPFTL